MIGMAIYFEVLMLVKRWLIRIELRGLIPLVYFVYGIPVVLLTWRASCGTSRTNPGLPANDGAA
jgi:hypothetical protein